MHTARQQGEIVSCYNCDCSYRKEEWTGFDHQSRLRSSVTPAKKSIPLLFKAHRDVFFFFWSLPFLASFCCKDLLAFSFYPYLFVKGFVQGRSLSFFRSPHKTHCHDWLATLQTHYRLADRAGRLVLLRCVDSCLPDIAGSGNFKCSGGSPLSLTLKVTWIWIWPLIPVHWRWSLRSTQRVYNSEDRSAFGMWASLSPSLHGVMCGGKKKDGQDFYWSWELSQRPGGQE